MNNWKTKKLGEVVSVLDNLRKPINSTERLQRINGKNQILVLFFFFNKILLIDLNRQIKKNGKIMGKIYFLDFELIDIHLGF